MVASANMALSTNAISNIILASDSEDGKIRTITLNNPKKRNCLSLEMMKEFDKYLSDADKLRIVILRASGSVFSSGHDLKELASASVEVQKSVFDLSAGINLKMKNFKTPIIAVISDQICSASGTQLIACADIILATRRSSFSTPGASVGLFCSTPGIPIARAANEKLSRFMLLTGLSIDAKTACDGGLISKVYDDQDALEVGVSEVTDAILSKSKPIIALGKEFFNQQIKIGLEDAYKEGSKVMVRNLDHRDAKIGIESFIKKKKPEWTHAKFDDNKK